MRPPQPPPSLQPAELFQGKPWEQISRILDTPSVLPDGRYLHWDELRYREPPEGLTPQEWWVGMSMRRRQESQLIRPMQATYGIPFRFTLIPAMQQCLHDFDRANVGSAILSALGNSDAQVEYQVRQLIEEAISSSEIEGARPTTRELARQLLREKTEPVSRDEKMILNNLQAMERMAELQRSGTSLSVSQLLELHRVLGEGALEVDGAEGTFRTPEHPVEISDMEGTVWHIPPPAEGLEERVSRMLSFANGKDDSPGFIHPIVRAILTHFWLGYEHPFRDGNGRIARALYYWCMLRSGYEVAEFLSISGPIDRSPSAYYRAFAFTESDNGDLTYFVMHQLEVMRVALDELLAHLRERAERLRVLARTVASYDELNYRQRSMLDLAIRHPAQGQTIASHAASYGVHYLTARNDLKDLEQRGLLFSRRFNKTKRYFPSQALMTTKEAPEK